MAGDAECPMGCPKIAQQRVAALIEGPEMSGTQRL